MIRVICNIISVKTKLVVEIFILILCICSVSISQTKDNTPGSVLIDKNKFSPIQILRGDTVIVDTSRSYLEFMPGSIMGAINALQDSNYTRAMRIIVPNSVRFYHDLKLLASNTYQQTGRYEPNDRIRKNLDLPAEYFIPLPSEVTNYQYNILQSQAAPFINSVNPFGMKMSLSSIGQLLGIVEDVSPVIKYDLSYKADVQVVIYSIAATVVASIFNGEQLPGSYRYTWNGRDDKGRKLAQGDYIGEVRIGKSKYIRKRIYIGK